MVKPWSPNAVLAWMAHVCTGKHGLPVGEVVRTACLDAIVTGEGIESEAAFRTFAAERLLYWPSLVDDLIQNVMGDHWRRAGEQYATERRSPTEMAYSAITGATYYDHLRRRARAVT